MSPALISYGSLGIAILFEVMGTTALQLSQQFTKPIPTAAMAVCYLTAFYFLTIVLRTVPVGIAYAVWSGLGIVLISIIGLVAFKQKLDLAAVIGITMIIAGVIIINLFSKNVSH